MSETLRTGGPYTLLAPTDEAFAAMPAGTLDQLLLSENKAALVQLLTYHMLPDAPFLYDLPSDLNFMKLPTVQGSDLEFSGYKEPYTEGGEIITEIPHSVDISLPWVYKVNGVVYQPVNVYYNGRLEVVDTVLIPPTVDLNRL